jgi:hypothetical protein
MPARPSGVRAVGVTGWYYLGGSRADYGHGIAVDDAGGIYVTGYTYSADFPTTPAAVDPTYNGATDSFVVKLSLTTDATPVSAFRQTVREFAIPDEQRRILGNGGRDGGHQRRRARSLSTLPARSRSRPTWQLAVPQS